MLHDIISCDEEGEEKDSQRFGRQLCTEVTFFHADPGTKKRLCHPYTTSSKREKRCFG